MNTYHGGGAAALLPNGTVLFAGGDSSAHVELYDPASNSFYLAASMNVERDEDTATLLPNGKVLIAGNRPICCPGFDYLRSTELYTP